MPPIEIPERDHVDIDESTIDDVNIVDEYSALVVMEAVRTGVLPLVEKRRKGFKLEPYSGATYVIDEREVGSPSNGREWADNDGYKWEAPTIAGDFTVWLQANPASGPPLHADDRLVKMKFTARVRDPPQRAASQLPRWTLWTYFTGRHARRMLPPHEHPELREIEVPWDIWYELRSTNLNDAHPYNLDPPSDDDSSQGEEEPAEEEAE